MAQLSDAKYSDYVYWLDKSKWTRDQAAFLFAGLDPDSFSEWSEYADSREWRQYEGYRSFTRLIDAGKKAKELRPGATSPKDWIDWAATKKLKIFPALHEAIEAKWPKLPPAEKVKTVANVVSTKERATLLVIIAALAKLAQVDISKVSKAAGVIEPVTEQLGARVAQRTIEEHLKQIPDAMERKGG